VADHRHKREPEARRPKPKPLAVIGPLAVLATAASVTIGVIAADPAASQLTPLAADLSSAATASSTPSSTASSAASSASAAAAPERPDVVSRSDDREKVAPPATAYAPDVMSKAAVTAALDRAKKHRWTTDDLNIWTRPDDKASQIGELAAGKKVLVTGRVLWGRTEIVLNGHSRWVTSGYLSDQKPVGPAAGLSMEPCPDPSVENGLTDGAVYVYRSVCHAFPQITSYGGWDAHGEHSTGKAIDIMTSDVDLGNAIAAFLQEHASELHVYDILWRQHIWTPVRASEGWRLFPDRGSPTANHFDHVHVSVY
jgi:hypothetical protein